MYEYTTDMPFCKPAGCDKTLVMQIRKLYNKGQRKAEGAEHDD